MGVMGNAGLFLKFETLKNFYDSVSFVLIEPSRAKYLRPLRDSVPDRRDRTGEPAGG